MQKPRLGAVAQKILLLLLGGLALGLSGSPVRYSRVLRGITQEWQAINRRELYRAIRRLYESRLVKYSEKKDGTIAITLNKEGREVALRYKLDELRIAPPHRWDQKWRIVIFDIPEKQKGLRDSIRSRLRQLGFLELQKSVFVHPFKCVSEVDFIVELYGARRYVRFIEAHFIDNAMHLKKKFSLS